MEIFKKMLLVTICLINYRDKGRPLIFSRIFLFAWLLFDLNIENENLQKLFQDMRFQVYLPRRVVARACVRVCARVEFLNNRISGFAS